MKEKARKRIKKTYGALLAIISIIIAIGTYCLQSKDNKRNEQLATPKFSLTKNYDNPDHPVWELYNTDGTINNAALYPSTYLTFWISNDDDINPIDCKITIELMGYYSGKNVHFDNATRTFSIDDKKHSQLKQFIHNITSAFSKNDGWSIDHDISTYFTLNYMDYASKKHNQIFYVTSGNFDTDHIYGSNYFQLEEIKKIKTADIESPIQFKDACVITVNYKHSTLRELLETETDYNKYLLRCIVDLLVSKETINDPTLGSLLLFDDGTLLIRRENEDWFSWQTPEPEY